MEALPAEYTVFYIVRPCCHRPWQVSSGSKDGRYEKVERGDACGGGRIYGGGRNPGGAIAAADAAADAAGGRGRRGAARWRRTRQSRSAYRGGRRRNRETRGISGLDSQLRRRQLFY